MPRRGFDVFGRRYIASIPIRLSASRHVVPDDHAFLPEQIARHPAAGERIKQVELVDARMIARSAGDTRRGR